jgi:hypothetical protein
MDLRYKVNPTAYLLFIAMIWSCAAQSHHSVGAQFNRETLITFEVEVIEFQFINPHPFMRVKLTDGSDQLLTLDMDNRREFSQLNIDGSTFVPGDKLSVGVYATHTESTTFYLAVIEHPRLGFRYETNVRKLLALE